MSSCVRLVHQEDIVQVIVINQEAFPTMLPLTSYQRELKSPLAHYIVAYDNKKMLDEVEAPWEETEQSLGFISRLIFRNRATLPSSKQYVVGFAGL